MSARSGDYRTLPWGPVAQDWFVNACAEIETDLRPRKLLEFLLAIEHGMGRVRNERWGPRLIDIDILVYDAVTVESPDLTRPHPRMLERAFVLVPLAEISPHLLIGETSVAQALARLDPSGIGRLA